jgi:ornithine decarboxylase
MIPNEANILEKARGLSYPTPFFFTSKAVLKHNYETFTKLFSNGEVYYALKSNADPKILEYLSKLGSGFEAASKFEIESLLKVGVAPEKIIHGTSVKPASHIQFAYKIGIDRFAADSFEEIQKIAEHAPGARVFIRAIVDDADSVFAFSERFGAPLHSIKDILLEVARLGLKTYGLSFHVGSQATHEEHWANAILAVKPTIESLHKDGIDIEVLDIGGGFPVVYTNHKHIPHLEDIVKRVNNALHTLPYMPKIIMEPGRGISATSTVMVTEVISRTIRNGKTWLVLDGGIYNCLYEAMIHQGSTQYDVHTVKKSEKHTEMMPCVLAGPTGDSLDIITRDILLPETVEVGDRLIFENAGAYTVTMACNFNGFPKPKLYIG